MAVKRSKEKEVKLVRSSDHRSHYVIGAIPQWTQTDLRLHMYNEIIEGEGGQYFVTTTQIIIPRGSVGKLMDVLAEALKEEGKEARMQVMELPPELSGILESEIHDKRSTRKKVQKIRRK